MANENQTQATATANGTDAPAKRGPGRPAGPPKEKPAKKDLMAAFQKDYGQIVIAEQALAELRAKASESGAALVAAYGKGPHKLGADKIVSFQNVQHETRYTVLDLAGVD